MLSEEESKVPHTLLLQRLKTIKHVSENVFLKKDVFFCNFRYDDDEYSRRPNKIESHFQEKAKASIARNLMCKTMILELR